jgi:hypothetical protein
MIVGSCDTSQPGDTATALADFSVSDARLNRRLTLSSERSLYALTGIFSVAYIKSVESVFEIIAEPNRRAISSLLLSSEQPVGEIERQLGMPQPTEAMKFDGWQRLNAEYAKQFGVETLS